MKADFVIPSWSYWTDPIRAQPLTQMYLATILEQEGHEVTFTDLRDGPKTLPQADVHLHTVASPDLEETKQIVKDNPGTHIAGGPHPTIRPQDMGEFDSFVVGRGEEAIKQIMNDFPNIKPKYETTAKGDYPFPRRHFLPDDKIVNDHLFKTDDVRSTTAQFSFGCSFACSFCANYGEKKVRRNSLGKIEDEIDYLKNNYGIEGLSLQDELVFPMKQKEAYEFFDLMRRKDVKWRGQTRALKHPEILREAKRGGLVELSFGLESVDPHVLALTGKKVKLDEVRKTLSACQEYGVKTRIYLLNGLPGETERIVEQTKAFVEETNPDIVLLSSLQPYPGSPIESNPAKYGIEWVSQDYGKFNHIRCRFEDSDDNPEDAVPYAFAKGKGLTRKQIMDNMLELQSYLRERGANI